MFESGHISQSDQLSQRLSISLGTGSFINADHFAAALVFPAAISLVGFMRLRGWQRLASSIAFLLLLVGILVSATRGSLVAVGVVAVYLAIVERRQIQLLALGAIGLAISAAIPNIWLRFLDPGQAGLGGRSGLWAIAAVAFRQHWLFGVGTGNFRLAYRDAYLTVAQSGYFYHRWMEDSHNLIVNTGVELGVIGVAIVLAAWFLQFRTVSRIPRSSPLGAARSAIEAGTIGLFVVAMTVDIMWYKYLWIAFMLAVLCRNAWLSEAKPSS
jgi:O-antigen ligase